jgi:hypothetical protein
MRVSTLREKTRIRPYCGLHCRHTVVAHFITICRSCVLVVWSLEDWLCEPFTSKCNFCWRESSHLLTVLAGAKIFPPSPLTPPHSLLSALSTESSVRMDNWGNERLNCSSNNEVLYFGDKGCRRRRAGVVPIETPPGCCCHRNDYSKRGMFRPGAVDEHSLISLQDSGGMIVLVAMPWYYVSGPVATLLRETVRVSCGWVTS